MRFFLLLAMSTGMHASVLWMVENGRPALLQLLRGESCVDVLPSPASTPRPESNTPLSVQLIVLPKPAPVDKPPVPKVPLPEARREATPFARAESQESLAAEETRPEAPAPRVEKPAPEPEPNRSEKPAEEPKTPEPSKSALEPASVPASVPQPASIPSVRRAEGVRTAARIVGNFRPTYPREALRRRIEGEVTLFLRISDEGRVVEARLHQSSGHPILDEATLRHADLLEIEPARLDDKPVACTAYYPVHYRLIDPN